LLQGPPPNSFAALLRCPTLPECSLLSGIRQASSDAAYLLCLDDDVLLHPRLLAALVRDMEADPSLYMATGEGGASAAHVCLVVGLFGCLPACLPALRCARFARSLLPAVDCYSA
jgi:hypothetical protein